MLGKVDLSQKVKKKAYKQRLPQLKKRLHTLQQVAWQAGLPVILLFESWDAAGKGVCIQTLTAGLDPRGFKLHAVREARAFEKRKPWLWRFWIRTPARGEMVIFDRSWYGRVLGEYVDGLISEAERRRALQDILDFERTLADEGALICKFFLHISPEEQKKRFKNRLKHPNSSWRVEPDDWEQHAKYPAYCEAIDDIFELTTTQRAPWTVVAANNQRFAQLSVFETVILAIESRLVEIGAISPAAAEGAEAEIPGQEKSPGEDAQAPTQPSDTPTSPEKTSAGRKTTRRSRKKQDTAVDGPSESETVPQADNSSQPAGNA